MSGTEEGSGAAKRKKRMKRRGKKLTFKLHDRQSLLCTKISVYDPNRLIVGYFGM